MLNLLLLTEREKKKLSERGLPKIISPTPTGVKSRSSVQKKADDLDDTQDDFDNKNKNNFKKTSRLDRLIAAMHKNSGNRGDDFEDDIENPDLKSDDSDNDALDKRYHQSPIPGTPKSLARGIHVHEDEEDFDDDDVKTAFSKHDADGNSSSIDDHKKLLGLGEHKPYVQVNRPYRGKVKTQDSGAFVQKFSDKLKRKVQPKKM